jgi:hypothetical protein
MLVFLSLVYGADNTVSVDQIGSYNTIDISQSGTEHAVTVNLGQATDVDNTTLTILQQGTGAKTTTVAVSSGINNTINIQQDGAGNHVAAIQNLNGSANSIAITQTGAGKHDFNISNTAGTINSGNNVSGIQSGGVGADKQFTVTMSGSAAASITVTQDNSTTADSGSLNINCLSGTCGTFSYVKH